MTGFARLSCWCWLCRKCRWCWCVQMLWQSLSELVLCYLARSDFLIGGKEEHDPLGCCKWVGCIAGQWEVVDVAVIDVVNGVWALLRRNVNDFFWREISLRNSDNFFSISFLRWKFVPIKRTLINYWKIENIDKVYSP